MALAAIGVLLVLVVKVHAAVQPINIAVILPENRKWLFAIPRVKPAIEVALESVYKRGIIDRTRYNISVRYSDSKCDVAWGINEAFNFYLHRHADVYFGPCCDYAAAPIARQIRFWDLPMVTAGAMAGDFGILKTKMYSLLTRVGANFDSLARFTVELLEYYQWNKVKLIYQANGMEHIFEKFCHLTADGLHRGIRILKEDQVKQDYFKFRTSEEIKAQMADELGNEYAGR
jgi:atrial natriuretic peptide clearance receptor